MLHPQPVAEIGVGLMVIGIAIAATLALLALQHHVIRRTGSTAIRADALHYATDLASSGATVFALLLAGLGWHGLDPWFGLGIGAYVLFSALRITYEAVQLLMDRELPSESREAILTLASAVPQVRGVHGLRSYRSGQTIMIQLHLELDDQLPLIEAHRTAIAVQQRLRQRYSDADILIHQDPVSLGDETAPAGKEAEAG
jgi:ferrous-iron efflux pump FieF